MLILRALQIIKMFFVFLRENRGWLMDVFFAFVLSACSNSSDPKSEVLVKTAAPTFLTQPFRAYTTTRPQITLYGECDPISFGLEWSYDQKSWTDIPGGCKNGSFSLDMVVQSKKSVFVRAKTKFGFTASAQAVIEFTIPPTSTIIEFASAVPMGNNRSNTMHGTLSAGVSEKPLSNGSAKFFPGLIGVFYGR